MPIASMLVPLRSELDRVDYLADEPLAMALFLAMRLGRPLLLEGPPGVGKSSAATALAAALNTPLIRLPCHADVTPADALYRWDQTKQMLSIQLAKAGADRSGDAAPVVEPVPALTDLLTPEFLVAGPLLRATRHHDDVPAVLLIDDLDRADVGFEAAVAEFIVQGAVMVPEVGAFVAKVPPIIVITSNTSRPLSSSLKRLCYYHPMAYPSTERATEIVRRRSGNVAPSLVEAAAAFVADVRDLDLEQPPGLAELIDWVTSLSALGLTELDRGIGPATLGSIAKSSADMAAIGSALQNPPAAQ